MRQALHLLIVRAADGEALAARCASRWVLPILTCGEHIRPDPKAVQWAATRDVDCEVVGQWLGRVQPEVTDWLMVMLVTGRNQPSDPHLLWTPIDRLTSASALIDYQGWAMSKVMEQGRLPALPGPFGSCRWPESVKEWIRSLAGEPACPRIRQFRSSAREVVLCARTISGDLYFKGLAADRAQEAALTRYFASVAPRRFARTLAIEPRADGSVWWLMAACPGVPATDSQPVPRALASVQLDLMASSDVSRLLPPLDAESALRWGVELVEQAEYTRLMAAHLDAVLNAHAPRSWIPMDLHPSNVLVDEGGAVRFIDLDQSFFGPAPLAMALFARRCRNTSLCSMYEQSWSPPLRDVDWAAFEAIAVLVDAWLGWQRIERKIRRGEVHGAIDTTRTRLRRRLLSSVSQRL